MGEPSGATRGSGAHPGCSNLGTLCCFANVVTWRCVPCRPDLVDMERVQIQSNRENLEQAFEIAERLGVTRLLDAEGGRPGEVAGAGRC